MQSSKLPVGVCDEIDKANRRFLWGGTADRRRLHLVAWGRVCASKSRGGLGLRDSKLVNMAHLGKLAWQFLKEDGKLWVRVLRYKYAYRDRPVAHSRCSHTWRSIQAGFNIVDKGLAWKIGRGDMIRFWKDQWLEGMVLSHEATQVLDEEEADRVVESYWSSDNGWSWDELRGLSERAKRCLSAINLDDLSVQEDLSYWKHSPSGCYSVKSAYEFLSNSKATGIEDNGWDRIWKTKCTYRRKFLVWLIRHKRIMCNSELYRRHIIHSPNCSFCGNVEDSCLHAVRDCPWVKDIWKQLVATKHQCRFFNLDVHDWVDWNLASPINRYLWCDKWDISFTEIVNWIWQVRNGALHEDVISRPFVDIKKLKDRIAEATRVSISRLDVTKDSIMVGWNKPRGDFVKINVDGAFRRTKREGITQAAIGGVMRDRFGSWITGFRGRVSAKDSTAAELVAIRHGLELGWQLGKKKIIIETDSLEAIQCIDGATMEHRDIDCILRIRELLKRKWVIFIHHIYREANGAADGLANTGLSRTWEILHNPCEEILEVLHQDLNGYCRQRIVSLGPDVSD